MLPILGRSPASRVAHSDATLDAAELLARARSAARLLRPGSRVALDGGNALTRLTHFLGADLAGCATLLLEPTWTERERSAVLVDAAPHLVLDLADGAVSREIAPAHALPTPISRETSQHPPRNAPFYLPTTSGSSGRPKVLIRSRDSWLRSFEALDLGLTQQDRVLIPGPLSSSLFLFGALHALHAGADVHLLDRWSAHDAATAARHATAVHLVPAMLAALLSTLERDPVLRAECSLRVVVCAGARVDLELEERLGKVLPGCELVEYYGSAEHSLIAVRRGGRLRPVVDVEVRDTELLVRSALIFDGYLESGALVPPSTDQGWSAVGDRAILHEDGSLEILGRASAVINTGARLVGAEEVESVLRGADGVLDVLVSATPHPRFGELVTAVVEVDPAARPSRRDLRARARQSLEPAKRPRRWLAVRELPRTASGKPARALVAEQLRAGSFEAEAL
ncbi:long-chain acyl-CoA synthetase [Saccharopolyspora kobensis]|uniref:Long-chain acyl-CoA synthetase n=1 Tax=Saccharopolyspora kobensis TaxID=146035 RepID=A0A1H6CTR2_9PSEU|nr:AMP-binding protein [Saccharopolyspora kobensis]SEG76197.1 long-chain acyl-CoA synthetase [Saccharopolyspora kobensis]SFC98730.1 long-chain acyl-CoA synthetase [Saccharopolyspora kobensis]